MIKSKKSLIKSIFFLSFMVAFGVLAVKFPKSSKAASLANFDPGNIISDYVMSNADSMSVADIDAFLKSKGDCNNTNTYMASYYPNLSYHIENGHFVCLAEERFGEGTTVGSGQTAAEIIYEVAHEYRINPQVLIVLLQKEQGLITDSWPNNIQYRSATGFGCPDTAECDAKYYGFKNQLKNAADLFRTVLDGGWTNYPLGENFIFYNPNRDCGGSVVNIQNLATSSLYRYTPYQPNQGALSAGYGTATCGAYGNRNFYLYFMDWFGDPTETRWETMQQARYLIIKHDTDRINPFTGAVYDRLESGRMIKFSSKSYYNGELCLRTENNTLNGINACVLMPDLEEVNLVYSQIPEAEQLKLIPKSANKTFIRGESPTMSFNEAVIRRFTKSTVFNGKTYLVTEFDQKNSNSEYGIDSSLLLDAPEFVNFVNPRYMTTIEDSPRIDPYTGERYDTLSAGRTIKFSTKIQIGDKWYYRTEHNTFNNINAVIDANYVEEAPQYEDFINPREMILSSDVERINPYTGELYDKLTRGRIIKFSTKISINGKWYYRTEHNSLNNIDAVVPADTVKEL
ncbi:hypothetical protein IKG02_01375 [Candidatus Saccharibacteria bacterium]|nr:hypothetical protein [Candidatus Saccharibacteria bacterium]